MRVTTVATVVSFAALAVSLTACSGSTGGTASPDPLVARNATASATAPVTVPATTRAPSTSAKPPVQKATAAGTFHAELTLQPDQNVALLTLENRGKTTVTLKGWPKLRFLGADGSPLDFPIHDVEIPGAAIPVTLKPGTTAFAGVKWTLGDKADSDAFVASNFEATPPGTTGTTNIDLIGLDGQTVQVPQFPIKSVEVGTLQPAAQGVLVF